MIKKEFDTYSRFINYLTNTTLYKVLGKLYLTEGEYKVYLETLLSTLGDIFAKKEENEISVTISWYDWGVFLDNPISPLIKRGLQAKMKITFRYKENGMWWDCIKTELITDEECTMTEKDFE